MEESRRSNRKGGGYQTGQLLKKLRGLERKTGERSAGQSFRARGGSEGLMLKATESRQNFLPQPRSLRRRRTEADKARGEGGPTRSIGKGYASFGGGGKKHFSVLKNEEKKKKLRRTFFY